MDVIINYYSKTRNSFNMSEEEFNKELAYNQNRIVSKVVSRDKIPASAEADATTAQFTSASTALVPIVAIAVCATVLSARTPAALIHALKFVFIVFLLMF